MKYALSHPRGDDPLPWDGDLKADFVLGVGNLTRRFVKSPVFPHIPRGWDEIDKCIRHLATLHDLINFQIMAPYD